MEFTPLAIFWMAFAAFFGPVFLIALVCSIRKAVRTRKEIKRRLQHPEDASQKPVDAEIITDVRRKPKIKLIEDEARRKEFRGITGSLVYGNNATASAKAKRFKDTDLDRQIAAPIPSDERAKKGNWNRSNIAGGDVIEKEISLNKNHHNNVGGSKHQHNNHNCNNVHDDAVVHKDTLYSNGIISNVDNRPSYNSRRRKSLGDGISPRSNGHAISEGVHYRGASALHKPDITYPGLKPNSHHVRSRRHSVNSSSPTLEQIPEVKCVEVEMNSTRSKSEDNLIDQQSCSGSSPYLTAGGCGSDNKGFARSTETTIM